MRFQYTGAIVCLSLLLLGACSVAVAPPPHHEERRGDANTPSGKLGQAAYKATQEAEKAGKTLGRKLDNAAHNAREGWNEAARKDQNKK